MVHQEKCVLGAHFQHAEVGYVAVLVILHLLLCRHVHLLWPISCNM